MDFWNCRIAQVIRPHDALTLMDYINDPGSENARPLGLLGGGGGGVGGGGDILTTQRGANRRSQRLANQQQPNEDKIIPHNDMLQHVITRDVHHPRPFDME